MTQDRREPEPFTGCFGCAAGNEHGLQLTFTEVGERAVTSTWAAPAHFCGFPGIVHGGVQAALLDEVMARAAQRSIGADEEIDLATVELRVRYRRPVPAGPVLRIEAEATGVEGPDVLVEGRIVDADGAALTLGTARWRLLARPLGG